MLQFRTKVASLFYLLCKELPDLFFRHIRGIEQYTFLPFADTYYFCLLNFLERNKIFYNFLSYAINELLFINKIISSKCTKTLLCCKFFVKYVSEIYIYIYVYVFYLLRFMRQKFFVLLYETWRSSKK